MDLQGKVVLVTGGAGHLGKAVTRYLLETEAEVVVCEHNTEKLGRFAEEMSAEERITTIACDVTDEGEVEAMMAQIHGDNGGPDALLNIVGGFTGGATIAETELSAWREMFELNLTSTFLCSKHALRYMLQVDRGRIVSISSKAAADLPGGRAAYAVAKAGVLNLTACMAEEIADTGVACAAVMPSIIDTPVTREARPNADFSRWVKPQQIAEVLGWLISDEAGSVNGSVLRLYGALT